MWWLECKQFTFFAGQSLKAQIEANRKLKETSGPSGPVARAPAPAMGGGGDLMEQIRRKAAERNKKRSEPEAPTND